MLTQPPESPRRDEEGQLYTQPPEETGEPPQRARFAFALVPERNVADVFRSQTRANASALQPLAAAARLASIFWTHVAVAAASGV